MPYKPHTFQTSNVLIDQALSDIDRKLFVTQDEHERVSGLSIPSRALAHDLLYHIDYFPCERTLHIGCGSGYLTSLLARLSTQVFAIEQSPSLCELARKHFIELNQDNITLVQKDGHGGLPEQAPFDVIVITTPSITEKDALFLQLAPTGQLLCLEPVPPHQLMLVRYRIRLNRTLHREELGLIDFGTVQTDSLIDLGLVDDATVARAKVLARQNRTSLIKELSELASVEDRVLYRSLANQLNLPLGDADQLLQNIHPELFGAFSTAFLDSQKLIPLTLEQTANTRVLKVATSNPEARLDELEQVYPNTVIQKILVTPTDFKRLWAALNLALQGKSFSLRSGGSTIGSETGPEDILDKVQTELSSHLVTMFDSLLLDAVSDRASDIHLEKYGEQIRIRLRVDGELHDLKHYQISPKEYRGLINVIKLRAELNIAEKRLPQGGRSALTVGGRRFDLRIHVQPSLHGEHVIIRLLEQSNALLGIEQLGFAPHVAQHYERLLQNPAGLVLVVGPTGSGKSTTLYAGLQTLAKDTTRKVITVEDPIEYSIDNIQQTRVRPEIGFSFSDAMRSFVRQDPDVILVGEIRDHETALEAIRASQTGHIVLSTLHANDAIDALQRLYDLDIEANSLSCELLAVIAQRLAKKICPHCREEATPDPKILAELFPRQLPKNFKCYQGKGCKQCNQNGTKGRIAVVEYLQINTDIRKAIALQPTIVELRSMALDNGLVTMRDSALSHVIQGIIPLSELPRILPQERMAPEQRGARRA